MSVKRKKWRGNTAASASLGLSWAAHRLPVVGKQFAQPGDGVLRDAREHIAKPGKRLDAGSLAGSDEASQHRRRLAATVAAEKCPVAAAQRDIAVGPFGGAVVDLQLAVFQKAQLAPPTDSAHSPPRRRTDSSTSGCSSSRYWWSLSSSRTDTRWRKASLCQYSLLVASLALSVVMRPLCGFAERLETAVRRTLTDKPPAQAGGFFCPKRLRASPPPSPPSPLRTML